MDRRLKSFLWRVLPVLLLFVLVLPVAKAQTAGSWVRRGQTAEARGDYDTAFEDYKHAYEKHPKNLEYKTHYERVRFQAAAAHVDQGRKLRAMGDPAAALTQYMRALEIDPVGRPGRSRRRHPRGGAAGGRQFGRNFLGMAATSSGVSLVSLAAISGSRNPVVSATSNWRSIAEQMLSEPTVREIR